LMLAAAAFLCLFFGQRLAKDYAGAVSIANYFIVNIVGLLLLL
jgi:putative oxidoreductase